jgi:ATP-dependent DNA helicase UvrD/PcrA
MLRHSTGYKLANDGHDTQSLAHYLGHRKAAEMMRRVERIAALVMGDGGHALSDALAWSATFHAVGARLLRERTSSERPQLVSLRDEADQAIYVADAVLENREAGIPLKAQAVLFRASHHSGSLEVELTRRNIPFVKFGGLNFLEAAHIKDVLAFLRWAQNPRGRVAGFRTIQLLPGVGPKSTPIFTAPALRTASG